MHSTINYQYFLLQADDCKKLWCTDLKDSSKKCRTLHMPWADGTACGANKVRLHLETISDHVHIYLSILL